MFSLGRYIRTNHSGSYKPCFLAELVVCIQSLRVLASDKTVFLGYDPNKITGHSITILTGARSDPLMLQNAIESRQRHKLQLVLYDAHGGERCLIVSFCPFDDEDSAKCLLTLYPSKAIMLQDAFKFADCPSASALVSADPAHVIHMVNDGFLGRFGCARSEMLGQPLHLFYADATANSASFFHPHLQSDWSALFLAALDGSITRRSLAARCAVGGGLDEVTCTPVVEGPNGRIRHLLVSVDLSEPHPQPATRWQQPGASRAVTRPDRPQVAPASAAPAADTQGCSKLYVCPRHHGVGPAIFPRRTTRVGGAWDRAPAAPVVVTPALVAALACLPLHHAAAAAGVSATAFKRACRKLGIDRWAYRRGHMAAAPRTPPGDSKGEDGCPLASPASRGPPSPAADLLAGTAAAEAAPSCSWECAGCAGCQGASAHAFACWPPDADGVGAGTAAVGGGSLWGAPAEDGGLAPDLVGIPWPSDSDA